MSGVGSTVTPGKWFESLNVEVDAQIQAIRVRRKRIKQWRDMQLFQKTNSKIVKYPNQSSVVPL